jgi:hypothetical protein
MDTTKLLQVYKPLLADAQARLMKRNGKVDNRDVVGILGPVFESIALAANGGSDVVAQRLATWGPADVTTASLRTLVQDIVTASTPKFDWDAARRHQEALDAEMSEIRNPDRPAPQQYQ